MIRCAEVTYPWTEFLCAWLLPEAVDTGPLLLRCLPPLTFVFSLDTIDSELSVRVTINVAFNRDCPISSEIHKFLQLFVWLFILPVGSKWTQIHGRNDFDLWPIENVGKRCNHFIVIAVLIRWRKFDIFSFSSKIAGFADYGSKIQLSTRLSSTRPFSFAYAVR